MGTTFASLGLGGREKPVMNCSFGLVVGWYWYWYCICIVIGRSYGFLLSHLIYTSTRLTHLLLRYNGGGGDEELMMSLSLWITMGDWIRVCINNAQQCFYIH